MNNAVIFDAVLAGVGGSTQAISNLTPGAIVTLFSDHAEDLANAVDALIAPVPGGVTISQSTLMSQIVAGLVFNRFLGNFIAPSTGFGTTPSTPDYAGIAQVIVTLYNSMKTWLTNPSYSVGSLSNVWYVDKNTTQPVAAQNGSINSPYHSISQAITANPGMDATLLIVQGNYTAEGVISIPSANFISLIGIRPQMPGMDGPVSAPHVSLAGIQITGVLPTLLQLNNVRITGVGSLTADDACTGSIELQNSITSTITARGMNIVSTDSIINVLCECASLNANLTTFGGACVINITAPLLVPTVWITNCVSGLVTINYPAGPFGMVSVDLWSYANVFNVNFGTLNINGLPRHTMIGTTVQEQLDSIAAGLVANLHWIDSRTP